MSVRSFVVGGCLLLGATLIGCLESGPVNYAPTADNQTVADGTVSPIITLVGTDIDGDALNYIILSLPAGGVLSDSVAAITGPDLPYTIISSGSAGDVTYAYGGTYTGVDSFTFKVNDGLRDSAVATVLIDNNNTQPTATVPSDPIATVNEDGDGGVVWAGVNITGWRDDGEDDSVTYIFTQPANGTLTGDEFGLTYTPDADFPYTVKPNATDSFTFQMNDLLLGGPVYTVNITVTNINDAPVSVDVVENTTEDAPVIVSLDAGDIENDSLTYETANGPFNGALTGSGPDITYTPDPGYVGPDSFDYRAYDGAVYSTYAGVTITVHYPPGTVLAWGRNGGGELGDGTLTQRDTPVRALGMTGVKAVAGGELHTLAVKDDGTVWAWGANWNGQLGDGTTTHRYVPGPVPGLTNATAVAANIYHSLAMNSGGTMWAWGYNFQGQLGDGTTSDNYSPALVPGLIGVTAIASGGWHSFAAVPGGAVWAWGYNVNGALGDGTSVERHSPVQTLGVTNADSVDGGGSFSVALMTNDTVLAWGSNGRGQLGSGTTFEERLLAAPVPGMTNVKAISAGSAFCIAVKNDGTVWAWGLNEFGQLGDGTTTDRYSPFQVPGLTDVKAVSAGYGHSLALKNDGTVWAWGRNVYGQLGDGTIVDKYVPLEVRSLWGVKAIDAGTWSSHVVTE